MKVLEDVDKEYYKTSNSQYEIPVENQQQISFKNLETHKGKVRVLTLPQYKNKI